MSAAGVLAICAKTRCVGKAIQIARRTKIARRRRRTLWALLCEHRTLSLRCLRSKAFSRRARAKVAEERADPRLLMLQHWDISPFRLWLWLRPDWLQIRQAFANVVAASHKS